MDNHNTNNDEEVKTSIFENNGEYVETSTIQKEEEKPKENVVTPIVERRDLADKTIDAVENFMDTKDHKKEFTAEDIKKYKTSAVISYIPFVSLYFVIKNEYKKSKYLEFHVNQGLILTLTYVAIFFVDRIVTAVFSSNSLVLNSTPGLISLVIYSLYFILLLAMFFGIINTSTGLSKEIPVIGKIKLLK